MKNKNIGTAQEKDALVEEIAQSVKALPEKKRYELLGYVRAMRDLTKIPLPIPARDHTTESARAAISSKEVTATATTQTRSVIPRWEPHEAHNFTKPYSRRSSKPEWAEESKPAKTAKTTTERSAKKAPTRAATLTGARGRG